MCVFVHANLFLMISVRIDCIISDIVYFVYPFLLVWIECYLMCSVLCQAVTASDGCVDYTSAKEVVFLLRSVCVTCVFVSVQKYL